MPQVLKPNNTNAIAATATSQARTLPTTAGDCAVFYNDGPGLAFVYMDGSTAVATLPALSAAAGAAGNATPIPVGASINFTHAPTDTHWAVICLAGGTANVYCTTGVGH